jgi:hypothetical protein
VLAISLAPVKSSAITPSSMAEPASAAYYGLRFS